MTTKGKKVLLKSLRAISFGSIAATFAACTANPSICVSAGDQLESYEAQSGETVDISLYDPSWWSNGSDCYTFPTSGRDCNLLCEEFVASVLEPLIYLDAGPPLIYATGD